MLAAPLDKLAPRRGGVKLRGARPWVDCAPNFRIELRFILSADSHEFYFYRESVASISFDQLAVCDGVRFVARYSESVEARRRARWFPSASITCRQPRQCVYDRTPRAASGSSLIPDLPLFSFFDHAVLFCLPFLFQPSDVSPLTPKE